MRTTFYSILLAAVISIAASAQILSVPSQYSTIAAAIAAAAPGQIIEVSPGTYFEHDLGFAGKAITLRGVGGPQGVVIDAQQLSRVFHFTSADGPAAVLESVTIKGGLASELIAPIYSADGGGILASGGCPTIRNCVIRDCKAQSMDYDGTLSAVGRGGGIACLGAILTIENSTIDNCRAGGWGYPSINDSGDGGGIYYFGPSLTVRGTTVKNCPGVMGGINEFSDPPGASTDGAGICSTATTMIVEDSVFESNGIHPSGSGQSPRFGSGGALFLSGSTIVRRCQFTGNETTNSLGGAIFGAAGTISIEDSTFRTNLARAGTERQELGRGGAIATVAPMVISRCDFIENRTDDSPFPDPDSANSSGHGGAILALTLVPLVVSECFFAGNRAGNGPPGTYFGNGFFGEYGIGGDGGAIYCSSVTVTNSIFVGNRAGDGGVDPVTFAPATVSMAGRGGAIFCLGSSAIITGCTFVDNLSGATNGVVQPHSTIARFAPGTTPTGTLIVRGSIVRGTAPTTVDSSFTVEYSNVEGGFAGVGNTDVDPQFVDRAHRNLHLAPGSPAIGAVPSTLVTMPTTDFDGESRPNGAAKDMGADQFVRMGTADDILQTTRINGRGRGTNATIAPAVGDSLGLSISSPGGTLVGAPILIATETFLQSAPIFPNPSIPFLHVVGSGLVVLVTEPALPPSGLDYLTTTPPGFAGFTTRIQTFAIAPSATNGLIAASAAHDVIWP